MDIVNDTKKCIMEFLEDKRRKRQEEYVNRHITNTEMELVIKTYPTKKTNPKTQDNTALLVNSFKCLKN